jgi:MerR family mercuric resistance operon transcriptional regulator
MTMENSIGLTIGELAKVAMVNVETIRYYQKRGLLPHVQTPTSGYKRYPMNLLERIAFIKSAQHMDFSLNEIKELFELSHHALDKERIRSVARERLQQVHDKKQHLARVEKTLKQWLNSCEHSGVHEACPIIESIKRTD